MNRKKINKATRELIYNKYSGHCAYCGCKLSLKEMQVDHIESVWVAELKHKPINDSLDNYMPACRSCNFYKSTLSLENFREQIATLHKRLEKQFIYRLAKKYGMVEEKPMISFYFEEIDE